MLNRYLRRAMFAFYLAELVSLAISGLKLEFTDFDSSSKFFN